MSPTHGPFVPIAGQERQSWLWEGSAQPCPTVLPEFCLLKPGIQN